MDHKIEADISQATQTLLEPTGLSLTACEQALSVMLGHQLDYADLYFQDYCSEHYSLEDGIIKEGGTDIQRGVGVRALSAEKTGFAYSNDLALPCLLEAAHCAKNIAHSGKQLQQGIAVAHTKVPQRLYPALNPLTSILPIEKIQLLKKLDAYARTKDPRITQVMLGLHAAYETILVFATDGTIAADVRPLVRLDVTIVVEQNGRKETGWCGGGGRTDYLYFLEGDKAYTYVDEAVRQALVNLESVAAPAGNMTVVLGPGWPGVLLHEAVGHGLEGDFNRKKTSVYSGKIGQQVASPLCTVVDDGTIVGRRGSLTVDDEGTPSQRNVLIENGILKGYLQDKHNARLMGTHSTGSGRRESYSSVVLPRMTNTFLMPGQHAPEEIIGSVENGLYAANFGGGSVDITSGKFVFSATEAYLIEKGKITQPVKGATLVGQGSVVMNNITMVGNDFALDTGVGICGKDGQSVPVGVGQPTLKIENMTVGGTK